MSNRVRGTTATFIAFAVAAVAHAQAATTHFDLPPQPLADAIRAVGSQTNTNILFDPPLVAARRAPLVKGDLTPDQALKALLAGTGIKYEFLNDKTVVISAAEPAEHPNPTSSSSAA